MMARRLWLLSLQLPLLLLLVDAAPEFEPETLPEQDEEFDPPYALLFPWVTQALGVVVFFILVRYEIPVPYVAVMFICGMFMGIGALRTGNDDQLTQSILQWSYIDSRVLLLVFLPGLIFRDAIEVKFDLFMVALSQILIFAFPMVLMGTFLTALVGVYVLPYDWSWSLSLTLGAILASTDPVAVASVLNKAGAPPRLKIHLSGESMLNDGSAVVFYTIFAQQFLSELNIEGLGSEVDWASGLAIFFRMSLGGVSVGIAFAIGLLALLYELDRRLDRENNVIQVAAAITVAYLSYYTSEMVCQMSGVIACVVCGITSSAFGKGLINDPALMDDYLSLVEHLLNTLLFTLGGVVWGEIIANTDERAHFEWQDWCYLFVLYTLVMLIRFLQVATFYPVVSRIGLRSNWQEAVFFGYAGFRGAVGIALALALDSTVREATEDEARRSLTTKLVGMTGGVTFLTLLVNGTTAGPVLKRLGLAKPTKSRTRVLRFFEASAAQFIMQEYQHLLADPHHRFDEVKFDVVKAHVPFLVNVSQTDVDEVKSGRSYALKEGDMVTEIDDQETNHLECLLRLSTRTCPNEILVEIRQIFLELLDAAYSTELATGELDNREDHGFVLDALKQSVAFTADDVYHQEPIQDWQYAQIFRFRDDAEGFVRRRIRASHLQDKRSCTRDYQQMRVDVLRSLAFIEAHHLAEQKLRSYLNNSSLPFGSDSEDLSVSEGLQNAILTVLEESHMQVLEAEEMLAGVKEEDIASITAHYLCTILLHRLAGFVETSALDGTLKEKEARDYLDRIDENISEAHLCSSNHNETTHSFTTTSDA